jgi:hypothetical protein
MNAQVADEKKQIIWAVNPFDEERYRCTWAHCVAEAARYGGRQGKENG